MRYANFAEMFRQATQQDPFPYQERFAESESLYELVHAPTGAGKTAAAILGWLWRRFYSRQPTPRRLAYCLPMRVLVEQTYREAEKWLSALGLEQTVGLHVLMGGADAAPWDLGPEEPAILIGTQDMLLSRALNRGYGMSRFRWPMHFGLLNNDCLWVLDEIQLMGSGLATSTQLQAFRESFGVVGDCRTVWMSATLRPDWLASIDFRDRLRPGRLRILALQPDDYNFPGLKDRYYAKKAIDPAGVSFKDCKVLARRIRENHHEGTLTLVVVNTVERSKELYRALNDLYHPTRKAGKKKGVSADPLPPESRVPQLLHSRFRPYERQQILGRLMGEGALPPGGRIIVATQVIEAGVDISARTLFTELAPWPSLVQRFGRCNRKGADSDAQVFWIDLPTQGEKSQAAPYLDQELNAAREQLSQLGDVGPARLEQFVAELDESRRQELFAFEPQHVLRRKDFVELFDTTPDLAGNDLDIGRFIRDGDDLDIQVFWREGEPPRTELLARDARRLAPNRRELCPVNFIRFREFLKGKRAFRWDALAGRWATATTASVYPGQVYWLPRDQGGYSPVTGWDPKEAQVEIRYLLGPPEPLAAAEAGDEQEYDGDLLSEVLWQSIAEHTEAVIAEAGCILQGLPLAPNGFRPPDD